jgi:hypothetical protein
VLPDDVQALARATLEHRLGLAHDAVASGGGAQAVIADALARVPAL